MHSCPRCPFSSAKFCKVVWHIRDHRHDTDFSVMCGVQGCAKTYREFESYRRHLYRCHRSYVDLDEAHREIDVDERGVEVPRLDTATDGTAFDLAQKCLVQAPLREIPVMDGKLLAVRSFVLRTQCTTSH
ncbi:hypothetical protein MTO96_040774 [Rhipicephalus appendiculatus]